MGDERPAVMFPQVEVRYDLTDLAVEGQKEAVGGNYRMIDREARCDAVVAAAVVVD
jgi:hypothetical protein